MIGEVIGHIERNSIEENYGNKCLVFNFPDENKEVLKNIQNFGMELKIKLKPQMVVNANMIKISRKSNLELIMIFR